MRLLLALSTACVLVAGLAGCIDRKDDPAPAPDAPPLLADDRAPGLPPAAPLTPVDPEGPLVADPLAEGPLATARVPYDFGFLLVPAPSGVPPMYPVAVRGELTVPDGDGPFPLVLFMHGRHGTCDVAGFELLGAYACPNAAVVSPVDSYLGYRPVADLLASHGYVVASLDANHINERDQAPVSAGGQDYGALARATLALKTLRDLTQANATGAAGDPEQDQPMLRGRVDVSRVGLMGHSRGGEGMARAVVLNDEEAHLPGIRALFALAPTDFARWKPTGVPFATLLPYCDGDVSSLHGSWMYDDLRDVAGAGPLHQVLAMGSNHNDYNDRWTGDDWGERDDGWCDRPGGDGRDEPAQQMAQGAAVMSSFFRAHVGGEEGFDAYWTGEVPFPQAACGLPCAERLLVSRHPPAGQRHAVSADGTDGVPFGLRVRRCEPGDDCRDGSIGQAARANVTWDGNGTLTFAVGGAPSAMDVLTLRAAVFDAEAARIRVRLVGFDGHTLLERELGSAALGPAPGDVAKKLVLSQVRVPLEGVEAAGIAEAQLSFAGRGEMQLADVQLQDEDGS